MLSNNFPIGIYVLFFKKTMSTCKMFCWIFYYKDLKRNFFHLLNTHAPSLSLSLFHSLTLSPLERLDKGPSRGYIVPYSSYIALSFSAEEKKYPELWICFCMLLTKMKGNGERLSEFSHMNTHTHLPLPHSPHTHTNTHTHTLTHAYTHTLTHTYILRRDQKAGWKFKLWMRKIRERVI